MRVVAFVPKSPFVKDEEGTEDQASETRAVVPFEFFTEIGDGKNGEDDQGDDFLNGFELRGGKFVGADAIGGYLEAILEKSDAPTGGDYFPERFAAIFLVAVPREGHEDVGDGQQQDCAHVRLIILLGVDASISTKCFIA